MLFYWKIDNYSVFLFPISNFLGSFFAFFFFFLCLSRFLSCKWVLFRFFLLFPFLKNFCFWLTLFSLRPIYTVQLCRMRYAYDKFTTWVVSCKSNLQLAYDCRVRHEECRGLLKHVLKPYDNRSDRQFDIMGIVYDFSVTRAARATKIACDNRKQKSYRVNRPL